MKKIPVAAIVLALCAISIAAKTQEKPVDLARQSAKSWLAVVDGGRFAQSWDAASQYFKSSITKEKWVAAVSKARADTGALKSRKLASIQYKKGLPNNPSVEYVRAIYDSAFQKWNPATETVYLMRDSDGAWRVAGYFVKPR